jgi:hypothetical protein
MVARNLLTCIALLALISAAAGCGDKPPPVGYCLPEPVALHEVDRVVMVELADDPEYPGTGRDVTEALVQAFHQRGLFHVAVVRKGDPALEQLPILKEPKSLQDLALLRKALECDALLVGAVKRFQPHPRMQVDLTLHLLDLRHGRLIWGVEHSWDSNDRFIERRIRRFFNERMRDDFGPVDWRLALMSPRTFQKYVAWEVARTLRPGPGPATAARTR